MKFGAHISTAKPFSDAAKRASELGCDCMQIFANSPQRWAVRDVSDKDMHELKLAAEKYQISPIIIHSIYLVNLASSNPVWIRSSIDILINDMQKAAKIGALGVNTHLGSAGAGTFGQSLPTLIASITEILKQTPKEIDFIIENAAGSGSVIGDTLEEIGQIVKAVSSDRVKVIIDTAHAFGSGYNLRSQRNVDDFIEKFDGLIGLDRLLGFHFNDSKVDLNSKRDRHADLGEGYMGLDTFKFIVNHPKLKDKFAILETPQDKMSWEKQLEILRKM